LRQRSFVPGGVKDIPFADGLNDLSNHLDCFFTQLSYTRDIEGL
jgi:hypothetical protein